MEYSAWAPQYERIRAQFQFPFEREEFAAHRLAELLPSPRLRDPLGEVRRRLEGRRTVVVGLAPGGGAPPVWRLPRAERPPAIVAADGAAEPCLRAGLVPDVVVTDLDGPVPAEVEANARGALVVLHAHGDNVPMLERWVPEFGGTVVGSWAGPPTNDLIDVGGFTDGDRSVFLAEHVGATGILLWAFDFRRVEDSDPHLRERKEAKLRWAAELIGWIAERSRCPIETWRRDGTVEPYPGGATGPSTQ